MDFRKLKIGYVPYLPDLSQPADRRRFPYFAKRNNVPFEIADKNKKYDIILLTASSNLSEWIIYKKKYPKTRFIFEMVDSLIFSSNIFNTIFKGIGLYMFRKETLLFLNYKKLIRKWLKLADLVLCSSTELKNIIEQWNENVIVTLDYLENEYKFVKNDFSIDGKMKLMWEGQGTVLPHFLHFRKLFETLSPFCELHVITNETYPKYGNLIHNKVNKILEKLPIDVVYHRWDLENNKLIFSECDCGIIPLNKKNLFAWHKPANKLISFWFSGIPTIVSATPAYTELMNSAGENLYCSSDDEWMAGIRQVKEMKVEERAELAKKNLDFVRNHYSDNALDVIWNQIFERVSS